MGLVASNCAFILWIKKLQGLSRNGFSDPQYPRLFDLTVNCHENAATFYMRDFTRLKSHPVNKNSDENSSALTDD